jgi:O-antigen ligase
MTRSGRASPPELRERFQEAVLLFLLFFGPLAFGCVEPWSLFALKLAAIALIAAGGGRFPAHPLLAASIGIVILGLAQWANPSPQWAPSPLVPFTVSRAWTERALSMWIVYAAVLWRAPALLSRPRTRRRFLFALTGAGALVAAIGLAQLSRGNKLVYGFRPLRYGRMPFGPYFNRGHAMSMLGMCLLGGLGLLSARLWGLRRAEGVGSVSEGLALQLPLSGALALIAYALLKIHNRGSMLALAGALWFAVFLLIWSGRPSPGRRPAIAALLALLGTGLFLAPKAFHAMGGSAFSLPYRVSMYRGSLSMLADYPVWGVGLGGVVAAFHPYKDSTVVGIVDHVHSDWLELPLQVGLFGAALWAAALAFLVWRSARAFRASPSLRERFLMAGAFAGCVFFLLHELVEFPFQIPANALLFLLLASCLWGQSNAMEGPSPNSGWRARVGRLAALPMLLILLPELRWGKASVPPDCGTLQDAPCDLIEIAGGKLAPGADANQLREGLSAARAAYGAEPGHPVVREAVAYALWQLERRADAREFMDGK